MGAMQCGTAVNLICSFSDAIHMYVSVNLFAVNHIYVFVCIYALHFCLRPCLCATSPSLVDFSPCLPLLV